jgi:hypothetical protein
VTYLTHVAIKTALHESARDVLRRWLSKLPPEPGRVRHCACGVKVWLPLADYPAGTSAETMSEAADRLHARCGMAGQ